jgi:hypothetical protein
MNNSNVIKQSNGICVTADTNFASKSTCEEFFRHLLQILKTNNDITDLVSAENDSSYETNILPVPLKNLSQLSTDIITNKQDYANDRADFEVRKFVAKFFDPSNISNADFYANYVPPMIDAVKKEFANQQGSRSTMILSQLAFMRLSQTMVNILLMKKPDGSDNIIRRCKPKPNTRVVDEDGNVSYSYYTNDEITVAEMELYNERDAHQFISFDVAHVPFTHNYLLLTTASLIYAERNERNQSLPIDEMTVDEIFAFDENTSDLLSQQFLDFSKVATRDLDIINLIEARGSSIMDIIHADCKGIEPVNGLNENFLSMKEKYMTLLLYIRVILTAAEGLIVRIKNFETNPVGISLMKLVGLEEDDDSYMQELTSLLQNPDFSEFFASIPFKFRISEHLFYVLLVNVVKRATIGCGAQGLKIIDMFSGMVGYRKPNLSAMLITNFFKQLDGVVTERAVENVSGLISTIEGRNEPMVSYAYRNVSKYMRDNGKFGCELAIIDSSIKIIQQKQSGKKGAIPNRYSMSDNNLTFDVDSLVDTVSKLTGIDTLVNTFSQFVSNRNDFKNKQLEIEERRKNGEDISHLNGNNLNDSIPPFSTYKIELENKELNLEERRKKVATDLDETYGKSFPRHYINLPEIPYTISEKVWAKEKCIKIEAEISQITKFNPSFDWIKFRSTFRELSNLSKDFAKADVESPEMVSTIQDTQETFTELCSICGLDDSYLNKLKKLEESLNVYENLKSIQFEFIPFVFKLKKGLENTMDFHLGKTFILYEDKLKSVQSLLSNPDYERILKDYFTPFFLPFATINADVFDITFNLSYRDNTKSRIGIEGNSEIITDVIMTVTYGSSDDTHVASKFRSRFPCILDSRRMLYEAKKDMQIPEEKNDFQISDIADKFVIRWARTRDQILTLSGSKGENVLKLIADTRGCDELYPFYDSNGMRIIMNQYRYFSERYTNMLNIKAIREEERRKRIEAEERRKAGIKDEPKLMFGQESEQSKEQRERNMALWSARRADGSTVDIIKSMNNITLSNNEPINQRTPSRAPFGGRKFGDRRDFGESNSNRRTGALEITNNQPEAIAIQNYVKDRIVTVKTLGPDGYFTYEKKKIQGTIKTHENPRDRSRTRNAGTTPGRFEGGLKNRGRGASPNIRGTKGTPTSIGGGSRGSTPTQHSKQRNAASPSAVKRSGPQPGAQSPHESSYLQPDHSSFINIQSGGLGFYANAANSPIASESRQLFQDIEAPGGVFIAPNENIHNNGTDRSSGSNLTGTSLALTSTPQHFEIRDDDYDI